MQFEISSMSSAVLCCVEGTFIVPCIILKKAHECLGMSCGTNRVGHCALDFGADTTICMS